MAGIFRKAYDAKWIVLGIALALVLLWVAWPFLTVIVYAVFVYYIARPIKRLLKRYIKNDTLLVFACMLLLVLPLLLLIGYTLLLALSQLNAVITGLGLQSLPAGPLSNMSATVEGIQQEFTMEHILSGNFSAIVPSDLYQALSGYGGSITAVQQLLVATGSTLVDVVFNVFLMVVIVFYLLRDEARIASWVRSSFPSLVEEHDGLLVKYARAVDEDLEKIFFGNVLSIVFFAIVASIVFSIINVFAPATMAIPYPLLMGMLCGVAALLPVVGMFVVIVPLLLYVLASSLAAGTLFANLAFFGLMVAAILVFVEVLPDFVLRPFMSSGRVHTGLLMFAYILGPVVFGIAGLFIGAIVLVLATHYFRIVAPALIGEAEAPTI